MKSFAVFYDFDISQAFSERFWEGKSESLIQMDSILLDKLYDEFLAGIEKVEERSELDEDETEGRDRYWAVPYFEHGYWKKMHKYLHESDL